MSISAAMLQRVARMESADAMRETLLVLAEQLAADERRKEQQRERTAQYRRRLGLSSVEWRALREAVIGRDGTACAYCNAEAAPPFIDHVVPLVAGGGNDLSNLTVACGPCNSGKGGRLLCQ